MTHILKKTVGKVRLGDGTVLKPGDNVSEAHLKKYPTLKEHSEEKGKEKVK